MDRATTDDTYVADDEPPVTGVPPRDDDVTLTPGNDATSAGFGSGVFVDQ